MRLRSNPAYNTATGLPSSLEDARSIAPREALLHGPPYLSGDEGQFLACSFWLVSALAVNGRVDEARELLERLIALSNDLGLLAEEYDVKRQRQVGNFPQAFSHLTLIGAAVAIAKAGSSAAA